MPNATDVALHRMHEAICLHVQNRTSLVAGRAAWKGMPAPEARTHPCHMDAGFEAKCRRFRRFRRRNSSPGYRRGGWQQRWRPNKGEVAFAAAVSTPGAGETCREPAILCACLPPSPTTIRGHPRLRTVLISQSLGVPDGTASQSSATCFRTMLTLALRALLVARLA